MNTGSPLDTSTSHDRHGRWPQAESVEDFRRNIAAMQSRIAAACGRVGRDPAGATPDAYDWPAHGTGGER